MKYLISIILATMIVCSVNAQNYAVMTGGPTQTITGVKLAPYPTVSNQIATKAYVDDATLGISGNVTISNGVWATGGDLTTNLFTLGVDTNTMLSALNNLYYGIANPSNYTTLAAAAALTNGFLTSEADTIASVLARGDTSGNRMILSNALTSLRLNDPGEGAGYAASFARDANSAALAGDTFAANFIGNVNVTGSITGNGSGLTGVSASSATGLVGITTSTIFTNLTVSGGTFTPGMFGGTLTIAASAGAPAEINLAGFAAEIPTNATTATLNATDLRPQLNSNTDYCEWKSIYVPSTFDVSKVATGTVWLTGTGTVEVESRCNASPGWTNWANGWAVTNTVTLSWSGSTLTTSILTNLTPGSIADFRIKFLSGNTTTVQRVRFAQ